jgi:hypothetical protein
LHGLHEMLRRDKIQGIDKTCRLNEPESNSSAIIARFSNRSKPQCSQYKHRSWR